MLRVVSYHVCREGLRQTANKDAVLHCWIHRVVDIQILHHIQLIAPAKYGPINNRLRYKLSIHTHSLVDCSPHDGCHLQHMHIEVCELLRDKDVVAIRTMHL